MKTSLIYKISLAVSGLIMMFYFGLQSSVVFEYVKYTETIGILGYACFLGFVPFFLVVVLEFIKKSKEFVKKNVYLNNLNDVIISQSHNTLFYEGNISDGGKLLTKEVTSSICADRCSIWLYNKDKTSIICQQLYVKSEDNWYQNIELFRKDFTPYFDHLLVDPIIVANDAEKHSATSCFTEGYLKPLGVKSMLDVPIIFRGTVIGVICIESLSLRSWTDCEVDFAQMLSSLYSFAYSVREGNKISSNLLEFDKFVDSAVIVSRADAHGKITYVNKRFEEVSGWRKRDIIGKDHNILNSGEHSKSFWADMYRTVVRDKKIWNEVVTNKNKNGELYYVDSYIKADFDEDGKLSGFMSIRYDVTDVIVSTQEIHKNIEEINKKNTYLEHAAKILRHDMHSGINTYMPRGISSLERRLTPEIIKELKIESPLKMIKEGLQHTQKVYKGVYEFTNLVKKDAELNKETHDLKKILTDYLSNTSYSSQVAIDYLPIVDVNQALFCTAVDNLVRNGLKYNDSETKVVAIFMEDEQHIAIQDNGRGMTQAEFEYLSQPYTRKEGQKETGTGLGLNICVAILDEHGFKVTCEKNEVGTKMKIKIK
jgi:chemotaxis family two-component system sensor kinase Cph1